ERLVAIVFGVTFITLITQALPFRGILLRLGVFVRASDERVEAARTTLVTARSGQGELDTLLAAGLVSRRAHAERKAILQRDALESERLLRAAEIQGDGAHAEMAVLDAQRGALVEAARRGILEDQAVG